MLLLLTGAGCTTLRRENTERYVTPPIRAEKLRVETVVLQAAVAAPTRDLLSLEWLARAIWGGEAWNADMDFSQATSFCNPRTDEDLRPERVARGACDGPAPAAPFTIRKAATGGASTGFVGEDAGGRAVIVKVDDADYPELNSSAMIIAGRIFWALGYNVPAEYIVRIDGTGDPRFDGRRGIASLRVERGRGNLSFDWFRYRREVRALRVACEWLNDADRVSTNTLVAVVPRPGLDDEDRDEVDPDDDDRDGEDDAAEDECAAYYMLDFNGALGCWQGRPKEPWVGHRHWNDIDRLALSSVALEHAVPGTSAPVVSPAIGRLDARLPRRFRTHLPNSAFGRMTRADARWMCARMTRLQQPQLAAIVAAAEYSDPADAAYMLEVLTARRDALLARYGVQPAN